MNPKVKMTGVLLCGGQSRRMGHIPKETLLYQGETFRTRLLRELELFDQVVISDNKNAEDVQVWPDLYPHCGPLSGIHAALSYTQHDCIFVAACDIPNLRADCIQGMLAALQPEDDCLVPVAAGRIHPTCAFYRKRILPVVQAQLEAGDYRVRHLLERLHTHYFSVPPQWEAYFMNINTPALLRQLRAQEAQDEP